MDLTDLQRQVLEQLVRSETLMPDGHRSDTDIAEHLKVDLMAVRRSLSELEAGGLITMEERAGRNYRNLEVTQEGYLHWIHLRVDYIYNDYTLVRRQALRLAQEAGSEGVQPGTLSESLQEDAGTTLSPEALLPYLRLMKGAGDISVTPGPALTVRRYTASR